ncbi:uncharacterized protein LAJ45_05118 [Morchella importuna]|uniref:uncharacterized protein n=1 Tax=Morchella importuna TaxID=1174673 RepID=UPI001E8CB1FC|nr:uncharacterized protein LAJ45_05118 [Morchella importuna]KAH8150936.1 hypothetical protein LAJ45_05118 [Morchella importuna]
MWNDISNDLGVNPNSAREICEEAKRCASDPTSFDSVLRCVGKLDTLPNGRYSIANTEHFNHRLSSYGQDVFATEEMMTYWDVRFNPAEKNYTIIHVNSKLVLDLEGSGNRPGTNVIVYPNHNTGNQRWKLKRLPSGNYYVKNVSSPKLMLALTSSQPEYMMRVTGEEKDPNNLLRQWTFIPR